MIPSLAARSLNLEIGEAKWKTEFGDIDGEDLEYFVHDTMPSPNRYKIG
jgi:hypothetical protein